MTWSLRLVEGQRQDGLLQGALAALALARELPVEVAAAELEVAQPWRRLLAPAEQLALRGLEERALADGDADAAWRGIYRDLKAGANGADPEAHAAAQRQLGRAQRQDLVVAHGAALVRDPAPGIDALVVAGAEAVSAATAAGYRRVLAVCPAAATVAAGIIRLPLAVDDAFLAAPPGPAAPSPPAVLVLGSGSAAADEARLAALAGQGIQTALFDVYHQHRPSDPTLAATVSGATDAAGRAAFFAAMSHVWAPQAADDDYFACEARAMGLQNWPPGAVVQRPAVVGWRAWAKEAAAALRGERPPPPRPCESQRVGAHVVRLSGQPLAPPATAALVCEAPLQGAGGATRAAVDAWMQRWGRQLAAYEAVFIDTSSASEAITAAAEQAAELALGAEPVFLRVTTVPDWRQFLAARLGEAGGGTLDVLFVDPEQILRSQVASQLADQATALADGPAARVLVGRSKSTGAMGLAKGRIGAQVATETIGHGLAQNDPARLKITWLGAAEAGSERARLYLYPHPPGTRLGLDGDEVDPPGLAHLLGGGAVDAWVNLDPYLAQPTAARALWARRPLALVGMLHSIHGARGTSEVAMQLLGGPSYPYDVIISPSAAGRASFAALLEATWAWLHASGCRHLPRWQGQLVTVPYGVATDHFGGLDQASCRLALGLPAADPVVVALGRFHRQEKSCLGPLLLAFAEVSQRHPTARLLAAGGASGDGSFQALGGLADALGIGDRVHRLADVSAEQKRLVLGAAQVAVAVSDNVQETFGLTVLEAMAAARPVVATAWNGYRELVDDPHTGVLVPTRQLAPPPELHHLQRFSEGICGYGHRDLHELAVVEPPALAEALSALLADPNRAARMGAAGRQRCQHHFEARGQNRRLVEVIREAARQARSAGLPDPGPWRPLPLLDPVGERFAGWASGPPLTAATRVRLSPTAGNRARRQALAAYIGMEARAEQATTEALLEAAARHPDSGLGELAQAVAAGGKEAAGHPQWALVARAVRLVKYDLLRVVG